MNKRSRGTDLEYEVRYTKVIAEASAGSVVKFTPLDKLIPVVVPKGSPDDIGTFIVRGLSLEKLGIFDGDALICRLKFSHKDIIPNKTVCIVYLSTTGEIMAKKVLFANKDTITLRASGGNIRDIHVDRNDVEVKAIAVGFQRMFGNEKDPLIPFD